MVSFFDVTNRLFEKFPLSKFAVVKLVWKNSTNANSSTNALVKNLLVVVKIAVEKFSILVQEISGELKNDENLNATSSWNTKMVAIILGQSIFSLEKNYKWWS